MANLWQRFVYAFFQYLPSIVVCLTFLPCGLIFGYTIASFVAERNLDAGLIEYGPIILGACWSFVVATAMFMVKFLKGRIIFWHLHILLAAGVFNLIGSCFYFANGFDNVGAFISYLAHSMTFLAGLSFLHSIPGKCSRAVFLTVCFNCYLLGIASAVSLISSRFSDNLDTNKNATDEQLVSGIYTDFAGVYLSVSILVLAILIGLKVMNYFGSVDCDNPMDNEFRIANSNGSLFDKRSEVIKRIQFFYVTKNQQWNVSLLLIFTHAIQYAIFIYFVFWFSLNSAVRLTNIASIGNMYWIIFAGSVVGTLVVVFFSVKVSFVANQLCLILITALTLIICSYIETMTPFVWLLLFFFGMGFANLQVAIVEVSHVRCTEVMIFVSYILQMLSTCIVYYYFVSNTKNSYFYSTDESTLMAQGFVYMIITSLLALVVGMKVPRTHRQPLFDIQYSVWGVIFQKHQIEQLNVNWLNDGTIPTISRPNGN